MRTLGMIVILLGPLLLAACAGGGETAPRAARGAYVGGSAGAGLGF